MSKLEQIEKRRAERKALLQEARDEQRAADLEALDALEVEHGDSAVASLEVPFTPDLPTLAVVKVPTKAQVKRYRDRLKPDKKGRPGDPTAAAIELCAVALAYPDAETFERLLDARPGLDCQLGVMALRLSIGIEDEEGKD